MKPILLPEKKGKIILNSLFNQKFKCPYCDEVFVLDDLTDDELYDDRDEGKIEIEVGCKGYNNEEKNCPWRWVLSVRTKSNIAHKKTTFNSYAERAYNEIRVVIGTNNNKFEDEGIMSTETNLKSFLSSLVDLYKEYGICSIKIKLATNKKIGISAVRGVMRVEK